MSSRNPHVSGSSPIKRTIRGAYTYSAAKPNAELIKKGLVFDMQGKFVGPLGIDDFLKEFIPANDAYDPSNYIGAFDDMINPVSQGDPKKYVQKGTAKQSETEEDANVKEFEKAEDTDAKKTSKEEWMYERFAACVANKRLCPGYTFVATPNAFDDIESKIRGGNKVDMALYPDQYAPQGRSAKPRWDRMALYVEFKSYANTVQCDPFYSPPEKETEEKNLAEKRKSTRGQLIAYAAAMFARQQRTHGFSIVILGDHARIIRWDRAGAIFTERFDYVKDSEKLCRFLFYFAHLNDEQQGYDPTAEAILEGSYLHERMMKKIEDGSRTNKKDDMRPEAYQLDYFKKSCAANWPKWKLRVDTAVTGTGTSASPDTFSSSSSAISPSAHRYFLVGKPHFTAPGMTGRGTRGYVALDLESNELVYLKDCWRVDLKGMAKEGEVIRSMNDLQVKYVPTLVCHGDVVGQCTSTQEHWSGDAVTPGRLRPYRHYRLAVKEIGCPLKEFKNSEELVTIIYHCIYGHAGAYRRAKIIHRDISAGNILILRKTVDDKGQTSVISEGLLNDWDLSKSIMAGNDGPRQFDRTGTWQFMSGNLLQFPWKSHELPDDLESFLHVLLYQAIRFLDHNCTDVGAFMNSFFDFAIPQEKVIIGGTTKILCINRGKILTGGKKLVFVTKPLQRLIDELMSWFQAYYSVNDISIEDEVPEDEGQTYVQTEKHFDIPADYHSDDDEESEIEDTPPTQKDLDKDAEESSKKAKLAQKLEKHLPVMQLFQFYLTEGWPPSDKKPDQLPRNYKADTMNYLDLPATSKRTASQLDDDQSASASGSGRHSKMARSGVRASVSRGT